MTSSRRSSKLQEFVAHGANVTCLAIGPSSGRVMVTGGEDKKVNMWAIGKPNVILSLSGHTTPIECVQFNSSEELVCAGSQSGTMKIWDLEAAKMVRTLSGHKANIKSLDFHPYADFVASGSMDTTVRLWDVRRKGCIVSYKGHTNAINHLRFSPDGRWVISAGEDSLVKLWDLNAGKLLADFSLHTGPVNRVEFHPKELLVATGSSDRTVKFWDLEKYGLIASTDVEANPVRTICFHPEGLCLFSGGNDSFRAYSWEPSVCFDAQTLGWGKVSDMSFHSNRLIAASYQATNVSVWVVSMNELEEAIEKAVVALDANDPLQVPEKLPTRKISPSRKSFNTRPKTTSSKSKQPSERDIGLDEFAKVVDARLNNPAENVFRPKAALPRSPLPVKRNPSPTNIVKSPPGIAQQKYEPVPELRPESIPQRKISRPSPVQSPSTIRSPQKVVYRPPSVNQIPFEPPEPAKQQPMVVDDIPPVIHQSYPPQQPQPMVALPSQHPQQVSVQQQQGLSYPVQSQLPDARHDPVLPVNDKMGDLHLRDFAKAKENIVQNNEETTLAILQKNHVTMCQILEARQKNLTLVQRLWTDGDIKGAIETASSMTDLSVLVDLMNVLSQRHTLWTLDLCVAVVLPLKSLISSNYESYVETGSAAVKLIMTNFSPLIQSTLSTPPGAMGVDLVHEERYRKCELCYRNLIEMKDILTSRTKLSGRIGVLCKELSIALSVFG